VVIICSSEQTWREQPETTQGLLPRGIVSLVLAQDARAPRTTASAARVTSVAVGAFFL